MAILRLTSILRAAGSTASARPLNRAVARPHQTRGFISTRALLADQGYGDGKGDPKGENPQEQPASSSAQESAEHPGPAPPDVGKGTGGGPTKASSSGGSSPEDASAQSGGSRSKEATETGSSPTGGAIGGDAELAGRKGGEALKGPQGKGAPQPKIHNQAIPGAKPGLSEEQKQEVERHNADFEKRHDRAPSAADDKVDEKFWKGDGGGAAGTDQSKRKGDEIDWNA